MKKIKQPRNPFALLAKRRNGGAMRPKSEKRKNGKNKFIELLKELDND